MENLKETLDFLKYACASLDQVMLSTIFNRGSSNTIEITYISKEKVFLISVLDSNKYYHKFFSREELMTQFESVGLLMDNVINCEKDKITKSKVTFAEIIFMLATHYCDLTMDTGYTKIEDMTIIKFCKSENICVKIDKDMIILSEEDLKLIKICNSKTRFAIAIKSLF